MKLTLNTQILIAAVGGVLFGFLFGAIGIDAPLVSNTLHFCGIIGAIFVALLKMILIPLIFTSIAVDIANLREHKQMNTVWKASLIYYFSTTMLAVGLGLLVVNVFAPGKGLTLTMFSEAMTNFDTRSLTVGEFIENFLRNLFINPVAAMANGQVLPTIMFALFVGIAIVVMGERANTVHKFLNEFFQIIMLIVQWIMVLLPIGIFCLLVKLVATQDPALFKALAKFIFVVIGATLFHGFVSLPLVLKAFGKTDFKTYYASVREALITAFSTSSSAATLPVTYKCMTQNLKADKDICGFVLPLGATINMDGTALYEAIAALFIANLAGVELNIAQQMIVFAMSILASIGAPGIPSAGMVTMVMVLQSVGLPAEAIAILYPIDRLLDAVRTMVNVKGDTIGCLVVQKITASK